eukprot:SAG11_NODE_19791_length_458_cov_4.785515_1_plen_27_part_01
MVEFEVLISFNAPVCTSALKFNTDMYK